MRWHSFAWFFCMTAGLAVAACGNEGGAASQAQNRAGSSSGGSGISGAAGMASAFGPASGSGGTSAGGGGMSGGIPAGGRSAGGNLGGSAGAEAAGGAVLASAGSGGSAGTSVGSGGSAGTSVGSGGVSASGGAAGGAAPSSAWTPVFKTSELSSDFYSEGADIGDIDKDGVLDLVAGPVWYKGPAFQRGGELFAPPDLTRDQYSVFFLMFLDDLDGDGYLDVLGIGDAGGGNGSGNPNSHWYKNPGAQAGGTWTKSTLYSGLVSNESPAYVDLVGDQRKELVFMTNRQLGYASPGATPTAPWTFTAISGNVMFGTPYVHGLGVGDVDGDGAKDIVERSGWWKQPATLGGAWERHEVDFGAQLGNSRPNNWGGAQIQVFDVDGDGDSDVVTSLAAHGYGLAWHEQTDDSDTFEPHEILPTTAGATNLSQLHALSIADLNGDGLLDLVTGKRYYAHPSNNADPGTEDPPEIRWFELKRSADSVTFTSHTIHAASGVGCNFTVRDVDGDGRPDAFIANKHGVFLHRQQ
jgi:hypothetical protein